MPFYFSTKLFFVQRNQQLPRRDGVVGRVELAAHRAFQHLTSGIKEVVSTMSSVSVGDISRLLWRQGYGNRGRVQATGRSGRRNNELPGAAEVQALFQ